MKLLALATFVLLACGGASTSPPRSPTPEASPIVSRDACPALPDQAAFDAAVKAYYEEDIVKAGLTAELAARPLTTIFTAADRERLARASADGTCERIMYRSTDGTRVAGFVVRPAKPGPHPVMIYLRGGNRDFGKIEPVTLLTLLAFADAGFVVVATQYRGVDGGEGADEFGGRDMNDVLALVDVAKAVPDADPGRLFLYGGSRGGMQALLAVRRGLQPRAVAVRAPMTDLAESIKSRPELETNVYQQIIPDWATRKQELIDDRSAIKHVDKLRVPILLLHGRQDWRVSIESAEAFAAALATQGVEHKLVVYEREEHQLAFHRREYIDEVVRWFAAHGAF